MGIFAFLVVANLDEAIRQWRHTSIQDLLEQALHLSDTLQQEENADFDRFLRESESEEVQRRISIIKEFLDSGLDPHDPGLRYLHDRLFRDFEEARMARFPCGLPAPHHTGLNEIISELQKLAVLVGSQRGFPEIASHPAGDDPLPAPAEYFDKIIELNSRWMSPSFPLHDMQEGILMTLSNRLGQPIHFEVLYEYAPQGQIESGCISASPLFLPETSTRSSFFRVEKKAYLKAYSHFAEEDVQSVKADAGFSPEDSEKAGSMLDSFRQIAIVLQKEPECELCLVTYAVDEDT